MIYLILSSVLIHQYIRESLRGLNPVSIINKYIAGRRRPVGVADGPIKARCRFIKNAASWEQIIWVASSQKSAFERAQNAQLQFILRMRKVSSKPLLSFNTFCSIQ